MAENKYVGLWSRRQGWYGSKAIKKKDLLDLLDDGDKIKIILRYNKLYEKDGNRPRFILAFATEENADAMTTEIKFVTAGAVKMVDNGETYVTVDEAIEYARAGVSSIRSGYDAYDVYCHSDLVGQTLTEIFESIDTE